MQIFKKMLIDEGALKYLIGWGLVFLARLFPWRPPNMEAVLAVSMPFAKHFGALGAFLFGALSIVLFDLATTKVGLWTLITALAYGALGIGAHFFFKHRESSARNYVLYAIPATILYDAATGLSIGPLFFGQPFMEALAGQIPFTLWHLAGNIVFAALLSPLVYRLVATNQTFSFSHVRAVAMSLR